MIRLLPSVQLGIFHRRTMRAPHQDNARQPTQQWHLLQHMRGQQNRPWSKYARFVRCTGLHAQGGGNRVSAAREDLRCNSRRSFLPTLWLMTIPPTDERMELIPWSSRKPSCKTCAADHRCSLRGSSANTPSELGNATCSNLVLRPKWCCIHTSLVLHPHISGFQGGNARQQKEPEQSLLYT